MDEQLAWTTELFESNEVAHWVESGTLLTLIRSGELTKYDEDIDLGVLATDVETLDELIPVIEARGYHVQRRSYHGRVYKYQFLPKNESGPRSRTSRRPVDVMVFRRTETHAWTAQAQVKEELGVPGASKALDLIYPLMQQYARSANGSIEMTSFPKSLLVDIFTLWLPRSFVDDIVYDDELGVHRPSAVEEYLTFRYDDWQTPVSEWSLSDDGAVEQAEPLHVIRHAD
ncbi:hypothetical protein [Haloarchaeobius sp. DFWS5]|uniref:hypothetical protein n=1 Tax=Haloarchaeobius sp. DFWS5 TaxID=3446114 RepID=UPI003EBE0E15